MPTSPTTAEGWYCLHDVRSVDWTTWKSLDTSEQKTVLQDVTAWLDETLDVDEGASGLFGVSQGKADLMLIHLRPAIEELDALKRGLARTGFGDVTYRSYSFLSVAELSGYQAEQHLDPDADVSDEIREWLDSRLYPEIPDMDYVSFYPMDKRREGDDNWYMLDKEHRTELMKEHGKTGRKYAGDVQQIISGAVALDDWEWGVDVFSDDPTELKHLIYEMRFDEVSARYAEFGPFFFGYRLAPDDLEAFMDGETVGPA